MGRKHETAKLGAGEENRLSLDSEVYLSNIYFSLVNLKKKNYDKSDSSLVI